jgi:hypothetical protein
MSADRITLRISSRLRTAIKAEADAEHRTVSGQIRHVMAERYTRAQRAQPRRKAKPVQENTIAA